MSPENSFSSPFVRRFTVIYDGDKGGFQLFSGSHFRTDMPKFSQSARLAQW